MILNGIEPPDELSFFIFMTQQTADSSGYRSFCATRRTQRLICRQVFDCI
jgi:hypothetical protein